MGVVEVISYVVPDTISMDVVKASLLSAIAGMGAWYFLDKFRSSKSKHHVTFVGQCSMCEQFEDEDIENFKNIALAAREFKKLSFQSSQYRKFPSSNISPTNLPRTQTWNRTDPCSPPNWNRTDSSSALTWNRTDSSSPLKMPRPKNGSTWM